MIDKKSSFVFLEVWSNNINIFVTSTLHADVAVHKLKYGKFQEKHA